MTAQHRRSEVGASDHAAVGVEEVADRRIAGIAFSVTTRPSSHAPPTRLALVVSLGPAAVAAARWTPLCVRHNTPPRFQHAVSSRRLSYRGYAPRYRTGRRCQQGGIVSLSVSAADVERELPYLSLFGSHLSDPPPFIRASPHHSTRDYGRVTVRDTVSFYRARWESWRHQRSRRALAGSGETYTSTA